MNKSIVSTSCWYDDKDVFDLLISKTTSTRIREYAEQRGVILPHKKDEEEVASYLCQIGCSLLEIEGLLLKHHTSRSMLRKTPYFINAAETNRKETLADILFAVKSGISNQFHNIDLVNNSKDSYSLRATYRTSEYQSTRIAQTVEKLITIDVVSTQNGFYFTADDDIRSAKIIEPLIKKLLSSNPTSAQVDPIILLTSDTKLATAFFDKLMTDFGRSNNFVDVNIEKHEAIKDFFNQLKQQTEQAIEGNDDNDEGEINSDKETKASKKVTAKQIIASIRKAKISGSDLKNTVEYKQFLKNDFCITGIEWEAIDQNRLLRIKAQFRFTEDQVNFFYSVKNVYERNDFGEFKKAAFKIPPTELQKIELRLQEAIFDTINTITEKP